MSSDQSTKLVKTIAYYAAFIALGSVTASLGPTLPGLAEHTFSTLAQISLLFPGRSFGYLLGAFQGGRLYDRFSGHTLMGIALLVIAVLMGLAPMIGSMWLLLFVWFVIGLTEGSVDAGGNTLIVWIHGRDVGPYMQALHFFFGLGAFISPLIIGQVIRFTGDINWAYWIIALAILPLAGWIWRLQSPGHQTAETSHRGQTKAYGLIALVALILFFFVGIEASYGGWIYSYATALGLAGPTVAAYLTSAFWGALTIGRLFAVPLSARFTPLTMLVADLLGGLLSIGAILLFPQSVVVIWIGTIGLGLSIASVFATALLVAERRMAITGSVTGWFFVGSSTGGMTMPFLIGQLFERIGPRITMIVILSNLLLAAGILLLLSRYSARRAASTLEERTVP
jgi:FHS family Na+ dependent glucose MFS transporter 1